MEGGSSPIVLGHRDTDPAVLRNGVRTGTFIRIYPRVYLNAQRYGQAGSRERRLLRSRAALRYLGGQAAISHTTALDLWELREQPPGEPIHVSVDNAVRLRSGSQLTVHRRLRFGRIPQGRRHGMPVVSAPFAVVESWPVLLGEHRRAVVLEAVRSRRATPGQLARVATQTPRLAGASELRKLLRLLQDGCRSPLEIWGALHVFTGAGMPAFVRQFRVEVARRVFYLDVYAERERVGFELDGAAWHGSQQQRERDIKRDALLASIGIQIVRFSYRRLVSEPDAVRREVLAILASRRRDGYP